MKITLLGACEEPKDALAHVVKVDSASSQAFAVQLPEVRNPRFDRALPRPSGAVAIVNERGYFPAQVTITEQRLVRMEDRRFVFAGTCLNCVVDGAELLARGLQRLLERTFLAVWIARCVFDHDLNCLKLEEGSNRQAWRRCHPADCTNA